MRRTWRGDRGGSAIEAALLIGLVALVMLPALYLLGQAVDSAFSKPCDEISEDVCALSKGPGDNDGEPGNVSNDVSDESPPADLEDRVTAELSSKGVQSTVCQGRVTVSPPTRSTTCKVTYVDSSSPPQWYRVEWTEGSNDINLTKLPGS